jgi:hypothetical protein
MTARTKKPAPPPKPQCDACVTPRLCGAIAWHDVGPSCKVAKGLPAGGPDKCDCLNDCGDDPWLKDGRAAPCERLQQQRQREAIARRRAVNLEHASQLLEQLGYRDTGNGAHLVAALVELQQLRPAK